jgi:hypothetical protein
MWQKLLCKCSLHTTNNGMIIVQEKSTNQERKEKMGKHKQKKINANKKYERIKIRKIIKRDKRT